MISRILVANRGEIARRIFRTCREMGIATVAVYSDPDSTEPHVREADHAVHLPGASPSETYLNIEAILEAAGASEADAIHPGYGFLSENAGFARAVTAAGLIWIGPTPESVDIMGSKIESKRLMERAGVPVLPSLEATGSVVLNSAALSIGFPLLVKASAGGGGKGMKVVSDPADLTAAVESAEREALSAFGDGTVFLEKYLTEPRHIEIQVFGDQHGNVVSMFERECSIQRRHQKIIEESPSPALNPRTRRRLEDAAVAAARAVKYVGAGTVEFLFKDNRFYFLEMNTRLQVEHPVTEMVTGLDLVRLQIEIADGGKVERPESTSGHAIEARLYAEDPTNDFLPATGMVELIEFHQEGGIRLDSGVENGSTISIHYDPMIAKVIAHAETREAATALLAGALRSARLHGPTTNRDLLVRILEHPDFVAGETDTGFLERHDPAELGAPLFGPAEEQTAAAAAALADQADTRSRSGVLSTIPGGWRNSQGQLQQRSYSGAHGEHHIGYRVRSEGIYIEGFEESESIQAGAAAVTIGDRHFLITRYGNVRYVDSPLGSSRLVEIPRFKVASSEEATGSLHAPMPGVILRVDVEPGDLVDEGQVLMVLEAMKMEHSLRAPTRGTVAEIRHQAGEQVETGTVLAIVEET